jgi:hypothetical protein
MSAADIARDNRPPNETHSTQKQTARVVLLALLAALLLLASLRGQGLAGYDDLAARLLRTDKATVIMDKRSYDRLLPLISGKTTQVLGESGNLICFRSS